MKESSLLVCFEGLARLFRRVWRRFVRGSREISLVPSLHRASTDALIQGMVYIVSVISYICCKVFGNKTHHIFCE